MPVVSFKSIWSGWNLQCFNIARDYPTQAACAVGFLLRPLPLDVDIEEADMITVSLPSPDVNGVIPPEIERRFMAVAQLIYRRYLSREKGWFDRFPTTLNNAAWVLVYANDTLRLTPRMFRKLDRECVDAGLDQTAIPKKTIYSPAEEELVAY